jgi:hypothetical protein
VFPFPAFSSYIILIKRNGLFCLGSRETREISIFW